MKQPSGLIICSAQCENVECKHNDFNAPVSCAECSKLVAVLRDASVRKGVIIFCANCAPCGGLEPREDKSKVEMPEFFKTLFRDKE